MQRDVQAEEMRDADAERTLLNIADDYDHLATQAEAHIAGEREPSG